MAPQTLPRQTDRELPEQSQAGPDELGEPMAMRFTNGQTAFLKTVSKAEQRTVTQQVRFIVGEWKREYERNAMPEGGSR